MSKYHIYILHFCFALAFSCLVKPVSADYKSGVDKSDSTEFAVCDTVKSPPQYNKKYHVDAFSGSNSNGGTSRQNAFKTISYAVSISDDGDIIVVWPGVYTETVDFHGKAIMVISGADAAVITNPAGYGVRFHTAEGEYSVLNNFVIRDCIIAVQIENSSPTIANVTVVRNSQGVAADGVAYPDISNSIFWANQFGNLINCEAQYSWLQGGQGIFEDGDGINTDLGNVYGTGSPMFADPNSNDFHLLSEEGRFYPEPFDQPEMYGNADGVWVEDKFNSPCIDAGDPEINPASERESNGGRINIGAYGGTPYASKSGYPLSADFNFDGIVDLEDFARFSSQWLSTLPWYP